jgi:undecaprenyl-diphosphatase
VARFLVALAGLIAVLGLTAAKPDVVTGVSRDLADVVGWLPGTLREAALGIVQLAALVGPVLVFVALASAGHRKLAGLAVGAAGLAALMTTGLQGWLDARAPTELLDRLVTDSWVSGAAFPSPAYLAGLAAAVTVLTPALGPGGRRGAWWALATFALVRTATAIVVPVHVGATVMLGLAVGSAVLVVFGGPGLRRRPEDVVAAAAGSGHRIQGLIARDGDWWSGQLPDGSGVAVRAIDRDERDADLLYRVWGSLQRRGLGAARPSWSPRRLAEHEALVTMLAGSAGVRVPTVVGVGAVEDRLATLVVRDDSLPLHPEADLDDRFLAELWEQASVLHDARIAHRRLNLDSVQISSGAPVLGDFSDAELAAPDELLAADVAELLVSLGRVVGPDRAVASAARTVDHHRLGAALAFLQPLALSMATRRKLKADGRAARGALLEGLRAGIQEAAEVEAVALAPLQRVSVARVVGLAGTVVLAYVLLAFVSNRGAIADALGDADLTRLPVIVGLTALTYVAGALSLSGAVTVDLPLSQTSEVMLAQSFLNRFTPANAGGMALRARYLQRHGVDFTVAATSVGLTSAASGVAQVMFLGVFLTWSGRADGFAFELPDASGLAVLIAGVAAAGGLVWLTPLRAKLAGSRLITSLGQTVGELRTLATTPGKLPRLVGGALVGKLLVLVAFVQSARAFGVDVGFAELGALYLTANTVASAAPTPGGVGAIEAALVAVLTGAGVDGASALSVVLVFRLTTFWLPVPPAWLALRHLRTTEAV